LNATNICDIEACIGRGLASIRVGKKLDYKFLYFYLKSIETQIASQGNGSTFSAITTSVLKELQIPLPPLPIQKRIAEILDTADALRRKDEALLKKYDELAQAIFIDMFGDPVKNEKGWEVKKLGEVCHYIKDGLTFRLNILFQEFLLFQSIIS
jgi:type I restriction enzyme S subunit